MIRVLALLLLANLALTAVILVENRQMRRDLDALLAARAPGTMPFPGALSGPMNPSAPGTVIPRGAAPAATR